MKKQMIMGLMLVVGAVMLFGCGKNENNPFEGGAGYTSDGRPAKALEKGELPKAGPSRNMLDYYKGKK